MLYIKHVMFESYDYLLLDKENRLIPITHMR